MDLTTFEIAGPSTLTTVNANILGGVISQAGIMHNKKNHTPTYLLFTHYFSSFFLSNYINIAAGKDASTKGSCLDDTFSISVPGGKSTGVICGKNSGEHCTYTWQFIGSL